MTELSPHLVAAPQGALDLERRLAAAVLARDRPSAEAVLAPDFVATGHAGNTVNRTEYLDIHFAPERRFTRFDTTNQTIAAVAGATIITGTVTMINANLAQNRPPARYVALYAPAEDGVLQLRFWQETPISDAAF